MRGTIVHAQRPYRVNLTNLELLHHLFPHAVEFEHEPLDLRVFVGCGGNWRVCCVW